MRSMYAMLSATIYIVFVLLLSLGMAGSVAAVDGPQPLSAADMVRHVDAHAKQGNGFMQTALGHASILCRNQDLQATLQPHGLMVSSVDDGGDGHVAVRVRRIGRLDTANMSVIGPGRVSLAGQYARLVRPGLIEEVSSSANGIRQDFIVAQPPYGDGDLTLELTFAGAAIAAVTDEQVNLTVTGADRALVWHRLLVTDATGAKLPAHFVSVDNAVQIVVDDHQATYPVRIDPTYADSDWINFNSGLNAQVLAMQYYDDVLYVGGSFSADGGSAANGIAAWDGSDWQTFGGGVDGTVVSLVYNGTDLYIGGKFSLSGEVSSYVYLAKWDGTAWQEVPGGPGKRPQALAWGDDGLLCWWPFYLSISVYYALGRYAVQSGW